MSNKNESAPEQSSAGATEETIESVKAELEKAKKDYLYLFAEFDNYRKNAIKERSELLKFGAERFARDLLEVVDNFDRALAAPVSQETLDRFKNGVDMIAGELRALLEKHGVSEVPSEGQPFDPTKHEALSSEPSGEHAPGHITRVFKKAYTLHDKLLRPAQVVVATEPKRT